MAWKKLLRAPLRSFRPYVAGKPIEDLRREFGIAGRIAKLGSNENPLGVSPKAMEAIRRSLDDLWLYPDDGYHDLRRKIAARHGCAMEDVIVASGSAEAIELAAQAFLEPGDEVVSSEHTFAICPLSVMKAGASFQAAPMKDDYWYDMDAIADLVGDKTKYVFLANPTNPTGTWFSGEDFDRFMNRIPEEVAILYDAAYEEFQNESDMPDPYRYFRQGRRIAILRTFSKAYGIAGIRVGYAIGHKDIIQGLMTVRRAFNVNRPAQTAAMAAMDDAEFLEKTRRHTTRELAFLMEGLDKLPVTVAPSQTNFLFINTTQDAARLHGELQKKGVIIRPMGNDGFPKAIRVSVGLRVDNERFLDEFTRLLGGNEV